MHAAIAPADLHPSLSSLVFTMTEAEDDPSKETPHPDALALPYLDVSIFSRPVNLHRPYDSDVVSWAFVEFNFAACRASEEIHCIRDKGHPVFDELAKILGSPVKWDVVYG